MKIPFRLLPICSALVLISAAGAATAQTSADQLLQRMEAMAAEVQSLRAEVTQLKAAQSQTEATAQKASVTASAAAAEVATVAGSGLKMSSNTVLSGYGEINYNRPTKSSKDAQLDVRRVVLGVQHRFNENTKFVGEFEWEHAVVSATDRGETAIEQAYIEHQLTPNLALRGGLFLIPSGLLNENHEPSAFTGWSGTLLKRPLFQVLGVKWV